MRCDSPSAWSSWEEGKQEDQGREGQIGVGKAETMMIVYLPSDCHMETTLVVLKPSTETPTKNLMAIQISSSTGVEKTMIYTTGKIKMNCIQYNSYI